MTKIFIFLLTTFLLTFPLENYAQKTVIYLISEDGKKDSCLTKILARHNLAFENYGLQIMVTENYKTIDSLTKADKNWFKNLDKGLCKCSSWKNIKEQNTNKFVDNKPTSFFNVQYWEFALIKKYKYSILSSDKPVGGEGEINRDGSYKH